MIRDFDDAATAAAALASDVADGLREALAQRPRASLVVPGGRSPVMLFERLAGTSLDWSRVVVTLADERWVPVDSPDSNESLVRRHLLTGEAAAATLVGLKTADADPRSAIVAVDARLRALPRPFDITVLGMGEDGHFASLFPGADGLEAALDPRSEALVAAITPPAAAHPRLSLTLACLLASRRIVLPIQGAAKAAVLARAMAGAPQSALPISAVISQTRTPIDVYRSP